MPTDPFQAANLRAWAADRGLNLIEAGLIRSDPRFPRVCKHGHQILSEADEIHQKTGGRVLRWCRLCRRRSLAQQKRRANAKRKAHT